MALKGCLSRDTVTPVSAYSHRNSGQTAVRLLFILALLGLVLAFLIVTARNYIEVDELELPNLIGMDISQATEVLARESGQAAADPVKLIVPMLERFIATDRGFARARRGSPTTS